MNGRVSKLLKTFARVADISPKVIKRDYNRTPRNKRNALLKYWASLAKTKIQYQAQARERINEQK